MQIKGKFVNADSSIPEGQAIVHEKLENAFDLVHECLLNQPSTVTVQSDQSDTLLSSISSIVSDTRDTLSSYASSITAVPLSTITSFYNSLKAGTNYVRARIPTLNSPPIVSHSARSQMVANLRSGLSTSGKLFKELEGVDDQLVPIVVSLCEIRTQLRRLKNQRVAHRIRKMTNFGSISEVIKVYESEMDKLEKELNLFEKLQRELDEIDSKRVDGKFVDTEKNVISKGQTYVLSMLDECFCLVFELWNFDDERN